MTAILEGIYKQGKIELLEPPAGIREGAVRVVVTELSTPRPTPRYLTFGKYQGSRQSTPEDFRAAEWHGEKEFDDPHGE